MSAQQLHAVLTGDLVASRAAPSADVDRGMETLREAARALGHEWAEDLRFTRFRGDGWQAVLSSPRYCLSAMLYLRARLLAADLKLDTRISAGIGTVERPGSADLSDAAGAAFLISGDHLEEAGRRRMLIAGAGVGAWQDLALLLVDEIATGWTAAQAEAAAHVILARATQEEIAAQLGITRQAVQLRLAGASMNAVGEALHCFHTHDWSGGGGA